MIENYSALTLGKYIEVCDICADEGMDELAKQVAIISVLMDIPQDDVLNLPIAEYKVASSKLGFLEAAPTVSGRRIGSTYKVGGEVFVPVSNVGKMTTAQYIDFQTYSKDPLHYLAELCSVFLVPKGKKYNTDYDVADVQALFRESLSVTDANDLIAFFLHKYQLLIKAMLLYSRWQVKRVKNREMREELMSKIAQAEMDLQRGGDGLQMWMQLQRPADASGIRSGI